MSQTFSLSDQLFDPLGFLDRLDLLGLHRNAAMAVAGLGDMFVAIVAVAMPFRRFGAMSVMAAVRMLVPMLLVVPLLMAVMLVTMLLVTMLLVVALLMAVMLVTMLLMTMLLVTILLVVTMLVVDTVVTVA